MSKPTKAEQSTRWWDFYFVRYAMGTVIGAIVLRLLCIDYPVLKQVLVDTAASNSNPPPLDLKDLTLLGATGMVYCYIASAPILVFHACRSLLNLGKGKWNFVWWLIGTTLAGLFSGLIANIFLPDAQAGRQMVYAIPSVIFGVVIIVQIVAIGFVIWGGEKNYAFYKRLASKRSGNTAELVESYRHLREHGNAFFIVLMEIVFGLVLWRVGKVVTANSGTPVTPSEALAWYIGTLTAWITPAVFVWVIGTFLERRFVDEP